MQCKNCSIADICEVAYMISKHALKIDIVVNNCSIKNKMANSSISMQEVPIQMPMFQKQYKDFNSVSKELRQNTKDSKVIKIIPKDEKDKEPLKINCPSCDAEILDTEIKICPECNKPMCPACTVIHPEKSTEICDNCFKKL